AIECDFVSCGHLELAYKPAHFDAFVHDADFLDREFGHRLRLIPKNELQGEVGSTAYHGVLVDEASAGLNPPRYVAGLGRAADRAGALLSDQTPVERLERDSRGFRLATPRGVLLAREVFIATNGYSGPLVPA